MLCILSKSPPNVCVPSSLHSFVSISTYMYAWCDDPFNRSQPLTIVVSWSSQRNPRELIFDCKVQSHIDLTTFLTTTRRLKDHEPAFSRTNTSMGQGTLLVNSLRLCLQDFRTKVEKKTQVCGHALIMLWTRGLCWANSNYMFIFHETHATWLSRQGTWFCSAKEMDMTCWVELGTISK